MILSFRRTDTQVLFETGRSRRFAAIAKVAMRKLVVLNAAATLEFLRSPPGNRLEPLKGHRKGSTASGSTINTASASSGMATTPSRWKSSTITEGGPS